MPPNNRAHEDRPPRQLNHAVAAPMVNLLEPLAFDLLRRPLKSFDWQFEVYLGMLVRFFYRPTVLRILAHPLNCRVDGRSAREFFGGRLCRAHLKRKKRPRPSLTLRSLEKIELPSSDWKFQSLFTNHRCHA